MACRGSGVRVPSAPRNTEAAFGRFSAFLRRAQLGAAPLDGHAGGQGFESPQLHATQKPPSGGFLHFCAGPAEAAAPPASLGLVLARTPPLGQLLLLILVELHRPDGFR